MFTNMNRHWVFRGCSFQFSRWSTVNVGLSFLLYVIYAVGFLFICYIGSEFSVVCYMFSGFSVLCCIGIGFLFLYR